MKITPPQVERLPRRIFWRIPTIGGEVSCGPEDFVKCHLAEQNNPVSLISLLQELVPFGSRHGGTEVSHHRRHR